MHEGESLILQYIRINGQIPLDITVDIESSESIKDLSKSEEVKKLLYMMKDPLTKLDKKWIAMHYQLKNLPHFKTMKLVEAGYINNNFLNISQHKCTR